jgi:hypothetical protein
MSVTTRKIVKTQTSASLSLSPEEKVTLTYRVSQSVVTYLAWYQQKLRQAPRFLIYAAITRATGSQPGFFGSRSGMDFMVIIISLQPANIAVYHYQEGKSGYHCDLVPKTNLTNIIFLHHFSALGKNFFLSRHKVISSEDFSVSSATWKITV